MSEDKLEMREIWDSNLFGQVRKVFNRFLKMVLTPDFLHNIVNVQVISKMKSTLDNASK